MAQAGVHRRPTHDRRSGMDRREGEARLEQVIEAMPDGVMIVSEDGTIRFANPAAERLFGRPADELVGESFGFPVVAGETTEIDLVRRDGDPVTVELRVVDAGWREEPCCVVSLRDITDRKEAEERKRELAREQAAREQAEKAEREKARLYEEARRASEAKSEFLSVMSHELRTPLSGIMGYTDLLETEVAGTINDEQREQIERIDARATHLLEIVEEILGFTRMEAGEEEAERERVDVNALAREAADETRARAENRGLGLRVEPAGDELIAETDPGKVGRILSHLLSNAVKFTDEGHVTVRTRTEADDDTVVIEVQDTGSGIAADDLERIFKTFWQVEDALTRETEGTGLGLAVARRLARLLDGDITVESTPGEGSRFALELPRRPCDAAASS